MTGESGTGLATLEIVSRSGRVVVWARPIDRPEVLRGDAEILPDGMVRGNGTGRLEIACPEGTDVVIGSSSGSVETHGPLGRVAITAQSGRVSIEQATQIEVRSASGRVEIGSCSGQCRVAAASGSVDIDVADAIDVTVASGHLSAHSVGDASVHGGSGRIELGVARPGHVEVRSQSGSVTIAVADEIAPEVELSARSGRVRCEIDEGSDGTIVVRTGSGSVRVARG